MPQIIQFIVYVIIFAVVAYGLHWVCTSYELPKPVLWLCGGVLLIIILLFLSNQLGVASVPLFQRR